MKLDENFSTQSLWNEIIPIIENYLSENNLATTSVLNYFSAKELKKKISFELPSRSKNFLELNKLIENYLKFSVRTTHPLFNNQLNGGFNKIALVADIITHLTNTSMATYEISPMATLIEEALVSKLAQIIGYREHEGIMVTGGSNANMMAIHCARSRYDEKIKFTGNKNYRFKIFVSDQAHYSFKKAMIVCGLGIDNLILVNSDDQGRMRADDLEKKIMHALAKKDIPLMVASTAGSTVYGAFDPISDISQVCQKFRLWHHVDGAWGAPAFFNEKLKVFMKGSEMADSFAWDAHKMMGTGLITSFFITKHKGILFQANAGGGNKYLFHENENADFDTGQMSLQCGRKVDCLKLWFSWQMMGDEGWRNLVEDQLDKRNYFHEQILKNPRLKMLHDPEYLNLCFQVIPKDETQDINQYNLELRYEIIKEGKMMINFSSDKGRIFFRMVFANNMLTKSHIDQIIQRLTI
jgi:glutamate/tyrosine decarboxylase-like PLP-dependent enzyme